MTGTMAGTALALLACCRAYGQEAAPPPAPAPPAFEVASVKLAPPIVISGNGTSPAFRVGCSGGPGTPSPGAFNCYNANIYQLAMQAYGLQPYQLPDALMTEPDRYNVMAKVPPGTTREQLRLMLQALLAERFKLTFHYERKEVQGYTLVVAKGGVKMKETPPAPPGEEGVASTAPPPMDNIGSLPKDEDGFPIVAMRRGIAAASYRAGLTHWAASEMSMDELARMLSNEFLRPVGDSTGLNGKYDFSMTFAAVNQVPKVAAIPAGGQASAAVVAAEPVGGITIFAAVEKYLGLKLEPKKTPVDVLAIDHVEKTPVEN